MPRKMLAGVKRSIEAKMAAMRMSVKFSSIAWRMSGLIAAVMSVVIEARKRMFERVFGVAFLSASFPPR